MNMNSYMLSELKKKGFDVNTSPIKFGKGNSKLDSSIITLSLPAGFSCPAAKDCRACAIKNPNQGIAGDNRKMIVVDGPDTKFRCFTAIEEAMRPLVKISRWNNFLILQAVSKLGFMAVADRIEKDIVLPKKGIPVRMNTSGDFFNQSYFDGWLEVARRNPDVIFYAYTKQLNFVVARKNVIPNNVILTASWGGKYDVLINKHGLRSAKVVKSIEEAKELGLEIDHDDSLAYSKGPSFALLLHGQQPKNSEFSAAWQKLKKAGKGGYGKQKAGTIGKNVTGVHPSPLWDKNVVRHSECWK